MSPTCVWCIVCGSINRPGEWPWPLTSKQVHGLPVWSASILLILLGFLGLLVPELGQGTRQTDGRTDRHCPSFHNAPTEVGVIIINQLKNMLKIYIILYYTVDNVVTVKGTIVQFSFERLFEMFQCTGGSNWSRKSIPNGRCCMDEGTKYNGLQSS